MKSKILTDYTLDMKNSDRVYIMRSKEDHYPIQRGFPLYILLPESEVDMYDEFQFVSTIYHREAVYRVRFVAQWTKTLTHPVSGEVDIRDGYLLYQIVNTRR